VPVRWIFWKSKGEGASSEPCSDLTEVHDRLDALSDAVRALQHEWAMASEEMTALRDRVHRELGHITRQKVQPVDAEERDALELVPTPQRKRTPFSSRKSEARQ